MPGVRPVDSHRDSHSEAPLPRGHGSAGATARSILMSHTRGEADAGDLQAGIETGLVAERDARHLAAEGLAEDRAVGRNWVAVT